MWSDIFYFFAVPVLAFIVIVLPAAVRYAFNRLRPAADNETVASPAKSLGAVEMQSIPLREIETAEQSQQVKAKPYVAIPAPFRISTASSHGNIV
jgi:hypothetical protein